MDGRSRPSGRRSSGASASTSLEVTMKRSGRKFDRFDYHGTITCGQCGAATRETGEGEGDLQLCKPCIYQAYAENAEADYGTGSPEHLAAVRQYEAVKKQRRVA